MFIRIFNLINVSLRKLNRITKREMTGVLDDLTAIRGNNSEKDLYETWNIPKVVPQTGHYVLYDIKTLGSAPPSPYPDKEHIRDNTWDWESCKLYVRMPYSVNSRLHDKPRWDIIKKALWNPGRNTHELIKTILSYNPSYKEKWKFTALESLFNDDEITDHEKKVFFEETLPAIAKLATRLPEIVTTPVPLLRQGSNDSLSLSQEQIASLLANAFFCTFPHRNADDGPYRTYPYINFSRLYAASGRDVLEKLKCIIHYFRTVTKVKDGRSMMPNGVLTFCRRSVDEDLMPRWSESRARIADIPVRVNAEALIERCHGIIQLDFANKYLGGGVLGHGSVQEEIRFAICPELIISMLFTEVLRDNEALLMIGAERYSTHSGYASSLEWQSGYADDTPRDSSYRRCTAVLAIDALPFRRKGEQAKTSNIVRELNKAWVGFSFFTNDGWGVNYPGVATGNWGCGAFRGSPQLKSLLQIAAAAVARRPVLYITFGDAEFRDQIIEMYRILSRNGVTVGQLYRHILDFAKTDNGEFSTLYDYLKSVLQRRSPWNSKRTACHEDASTKETRQPTPDTTPARKSNSPETEMNSQNILQETSPQDLIRAELHSPDLFTPEEMNVDQPETRNFKKKSPMNSHITEYKQQRKRAKCVSDSDDEMAGNSNKMAATETKMATHTLRLFEEMEKFDETNGNLNLSISQRINFDVEKKNIEMDIDTKDEVAPEKEKKKTYNLITHYFPITNKKK